MISAKFNLTPADVDSESIFMEVQIDFDGERTIVFVLDENRVILDDDEVKSFFNVIDSVRELWKVEKAIGVVPVRR